MTSLIASSSDWVIGDLPLSFRQTVLWYQPSRRTRLDWPPVPRSSLSESQRDRSAEECPGLWLLSLSLVG
jgi:hypothetical protein